MPWFLKEFGCVLSKGELQFVTFRHCCIEIKLKFVVFLGVDNALTH